MSNSQINYSPNKIVRTFLFLYSALITTFTLSAQQISNVEYSFNKEKEEITVNCYLESLSPRDLTVSYSMDSGQTWSPCISVSGNIKSQITGEKEIIWKPLQDKVTTKVFLFKVDAEIEMIFVQGGLFTMGCTREQRGDCESDEKPPHQVLLNDFYISKYEVTQAIWKEVMGTNPSKFNGCDSCPVENVTWSEVQVFIRKFNAQTGKNYRLPTEAEWEYAARGGVHCRDNKYSGSNNIREVAWYGSNSNGTTHPVGTKKANELGIYDMSGNVWELCQDWYGNYSVLQNHNPHGAGGGYYRVMRGGGWDGSSFYCRVANRGNSKPNERHDSVGFRLVLP
jgi:formylglycine-generating enzyme required for sulfatase activity